MRTEELFSGLSDEELEALASEILAALEGQDGAFSLPWPAAPEDTGTGGSSEAGGVYMDGTALRSLLEAAYGQASRASDAGEAEPAPEALRTPDGEAAEGFVSLRRDADTGITAPQGGGGAFSGRADVFSGFRGDMEKISDFFMRDSRRYDAGFIKY